MSASEKMQFILTANADGFVKAMQRSGDAADKELGKAQSKLDTVAGKMTKFGAGAVAASGVAAAGLYKLGQSASDLGESVNAVEVTFGNAADGVLKLGKEAAKSVGLSKTEFNSLAVQFSSFATTVAGDGGNVVGTLDDLTTRAADFASVMNLDVAEAARVFQSGLAGETEPLKKFGIDLSAAAVQSFALANGIAKAGETMTEAEKVQARYGLLMEATSKTQGDFANTSDSAANQQRILTAELKNAASDIGAGILPVMTKLIGIVGDGVSAFSDLPDPLKKTIGSFAVMGTGALALGGSLSFAIGKTIQMRDNLSKLGTKGATAFSLLAVGAAAFALRSQALEKSNQAMTDSFNELSRVADEDLFGQFILSLGRAAMAGEGGADAMREFAQTNIEAALRVRNHLDALVEMGTATDGQVQILGLLTTAVQDETRARAEAARTASDAAEISHELSKEQRDEADAADHAAKAIRGLSKDVRDDRDAMVDAKRATDDMERSLTKMDVALETLRGHLSDRAAYDNMKDALGDLMTTMADTESSWGDLGEASDAAISATADYIEAIDAMPPEVKTKLYQELDKGNLDYVQSVLDRWEQGYRIPLYPKVITPTGGANPGAVIPVVGAFDTGGVVPGPVGKPQLAMVHSGETILPTHKGGGGVGVATVAAPNVNITINAPTGNAADIERSVVAAIKRWQQRGGTI